MRKSINHKDKINNVISLTNSMYDKTLYKNKSFFNQIDFQYTV